MTTSITASTTRRLGGALVALGLAAAETPQSRGGACAQRRSVQPKMRLRAALIAVLGVLVGLATTAAEAQVTAYVTNFNNSSVSVIDTATNTVVATVSVGNFPRDVAVTPDGARAYVANVLSDTVSVIDTVTNAVVATVAVGDGPRSVAVMPDGARAYVTNAASNTVSVIATATNTVVATVPVGSAPAGVAIGSFDGDGDGIADGDDNCPDDANPGQLDTDEDGEGDACDADDDGDGDEDTADNCPLDANPDQADGDGDGLGDACDPETNADLDNDGVPDSADRCLPTAPGEVVDADGCSIAQLCRCAGPWKHHAAYLVCVAKTANDFRKDGLISVRELLKVVLEAGKSQCGKKK